jgi:sugar/nucleoside kinase (ribokinase family)
LLTQEKRWNTHVYAKPYLNDSELNRIDFGGFNKLDTGNAEKLITLLEQSLAASDVVIINEQIESGIHKSAVFRKQLASLIRTHRTKMFLLDSRHYSTFYSGTVRQLNETAAALLCGLKNTPHEKITSSVTKACALRLWKKWKTPLIVTRGEKGSFVIDDGGVHEIRGLHIAGKLDTVGAGDSMIAGTSAALAAGAQLVTAAELGNFAAAITVRKLFQTGTARPEEILAVARNKKIEHPKG